MSQQKQLIENCEASVKDWLIGREKVAIAKAALSQLIQQHPQDSLPRRYLARVLFHEAAGAISPGTVGSNSSLQRIQLLTEAYEHAAVATDLTPNSLSCAALRATLAINLLVEESALLSPSCAVPEQQTGHPAGSSQQQQAAEAGSSRSSNSSTLDVKCQELLQRFLGSIHACKTALEHPSPLLDEPLITFTTASHTTCDPCSLLVEKIMDCCRAGKLQEVVAEKRSVLVSMQQVLQSCYALLDSTQVPLASIIRLLQHILRPYGAEQQMLATTRYTNNAAGNSSGSSSAAQAQLLGPQLHHAAIGELLRLLRPPNNAAVQPPAAAATAAPAPGGAASTAAAGAGAGRGCDAADLAPLPLSVEKPWDSPRATAGSAGAKAATGSSRVGAKSKGARSRAASTAAGAGKKRERSRHERFLDVESWWRSCSPEQRLQLLRVPLAPLLAGVQQESGAAAADVLMEGLVLLKEQEHSSCYWLCAVCDRKFHTAREFNLHLQSCHEQLVPTQQTQHACAHKPLLQASAAGAAAAGAAAPPPPQLPLPLGSSLLPPPVSYVTCSSCSAPVVGTYYTRSDAPSKQLDSGCKEAAAAAADRTSTLCTKCYNQQATRSAGNEGAQQRSYTKVCPHAPTSPSSAWSESCSEFISTRGSFSSSPEEGGAAETLGDADGPAGAAAAASAAAAANHSMMRQCDAGCRVGVVGAGSSGCLRGGTGGSCTPQGLLAWRLQQQRALAWTSRWSDEFPCSNSSSSSGGGGKPAGLEHSGSPGQHKQQQDTAVLPPPGSGIFVFGSNHGSGAGTSSGAAAASGPDLSQQQVVQPLARANSSSSTTGLSQQQQQQPGAGLNRLQAYWGQQQLLLCSTDAAATELLDGLEVVQQAKYFDTNSQGRFTAGSSPQRSAGRPLGLGLYGLGPAPLTGTKRSAAAAASGQVTPAAPGSAAVSPLRPGAGVAGPPVSPSPSTAVGLGVSTGLGAVAVGCVGPSASHAAAEAEAGCDADTGTPSAANRSWRDWLLPRKLLQWNDVADEEQALAHLPAPSISSASDLSHAGDLGDMHELDSSIAAPPGQGQQAAVGDHAAAAASEQAQASSSCQPADAAASAAAPAPNAPAQQQGSSGSMNSTDMQSPASQELGASAATATLAAAAASAGGSHGASGPSSPRTPCARDSTRGGGSTAVFDATLDSPSQTAGRSAGPSAAGTGPAGTGPAGTGGCSPQQQQQQVAAVSSPVAADELGTDGLDSISRCLAAASPAVLADEVTGCMQTIYEADPDIADGTLLCLLDFLQRKLNPKGYRRVSCDKAAAALAQASRRSSSGSPLQLEAVSPAAAAAAAAVGLPPEDATLAAELLAAPELAFMCPRALRAAMACLSSSDLHMVLAYIVRQSGAPMPPGAGDGRSSSSCGSSHVGCSVGDSSSNAGSESGEEDEVESVSASDSQGSDEETGCMALFQLYQQEAEGGLIDGLAAGGQLRLLAGPGAAAAAAAPAGPAAAASGSKEPANSKQARGGSQQQRRQQGGKGAPSAGSAKGDSSKAQPEQQQQQQLMEPVLLVSPWWLEHLRQSSKGKDPAPDTAADLRVLRWVYGNIESAQAEELASRQASLQGGLVRSAALLEMHEGLAEGWRRMQRVIDRQRRLELLRGRVKATFAEVKSLEDAAQHATSQQASFFLDSLKSYLAATTPPPAAPAPALPAPSSTSSSSSSGTSCSSSSTAPAAATAASAAQQQPAAQAAAAAAAAVLSPLMQLTTYMTKLGPLYLCDAAVAAVRAAPLLASDASQQYACALLERELAVLTLLEAKLEHDVAHARSRLQDAASRLGSKRSTELACAEAEQAKLVAEGPASHRKKDLLDKATKETEHRQKLADVKVRIEAAKAAIAEDEALAATAELAAAEGTAALLHVQDLGRQMNMRLKTLQDFNAQLAALQPQMQASSTTQQRLPIAAGDGKGTGSSSSCCSGGYGSPDSHSGGSSACSSPQLTEGLQQQGSSPAAAAAAAAPSGYTSAHAEWSLRARRLECLMCRVLWVAETIKLFDGQYDTAGIAGQHSSTAVDGAAPVPAAPAAAPAAAVGQATVPGVLGPQGYTQPRTTPADMLAASRWVKAQGEELGTAFHAAAEELGLLRARIQQLACVDLSFEIHAAALKCIRQRIEAAAAAAQEMRSQQLLLELAAEEEAAANKKAAAASSTSKNQQQQQQQQSAPEASVPAAAAAAAAAEPSSSKAAAAGAAAASASTGSAAQPAQSSKAGKGKKGKQQEAKAAASKPTPKASTKQQQQQDVAAAAAEAERQAAERQQALEAARAAREAAIEAELEKRRQELLAMEEAAEAELIRQAEEASLREQQSLKAAAEKECQRREQQARQQAAAAGTAASAGRGATPTKQQQQQQQQQQSKGQQARPGAAAAGAVAGAAASKAGVGRGGQQTAGKAANKPAALTTAAAGTPGASAAAAATKRQQQQQQQQPLQPVAAVSPGAATPPSGKKAGRAVAAAAPATAGNNRGTKLQPGSAGTTPVKQPQQRPQQKLSERMQPPPPPPRAPAPVLLDFGPTPAEAYAAKQAGMAAQAAAAAAAETAAAPAQDTAARHQHKQQQQQLPLGSSMSKAAASGAAAAAGDGSGEASGLTAADAEVHMPLSAGSSSSHLALLSQGGLDGAAQLPAASARAPSPVAAAGPAAAAGVGASSAAPAASAAAASGLGSRSSSRSFAAAGDAVLADFSLAPSTQALSLGSGHLQFQAAASEAVRVLSGPSSMSLNLSGSSSAQGGGVQELGLGFGGLGQLGLSSPAPTGLSELNAAAEVSGLGGARGAAAIMFGSSSGSGGNSSAADRPAAGAASLSAAAAPGSSRGNHLLPPRPSVVSSLGDSLLGVSVGPAATAGFEAAGGIFGSQPGSMGGLSGQLGVGAQHSSFGVGAAEHLVGGFEPGSPLLGSLQTEDAPHIQSIMSLLDDTGSSGPLAGQGPADVGGSSSSSSSLGRGGVKPGRRQQQQQQQQLGQQSKQLVRQQQQQRQKQQQQLQQRPSSRGRGSVGPAADNSSKAPLGRPAAGPHAAAAGPGVRSSSSAGSSAEFGHPSTGSTSSSINSNLSPVHPPGLPAPLTAAAGLGSRPSSAGSSSTAAGEAFGSSALHQQQQQQQVKHASQAASAAQLWGGGPFGAVGLGASQGGATAGSSSSWGGMSGLGLEADAAPARDQQQRPGSAGLAGSFVSAAHMSQANKDAHIAAATAAAAAAAAATAAVQQAQQQAAVAAAAAAAASVGGQQGRGGLRAHSTGLQGLYQQGQQHDVSSAAAALFGGSAGLLSGAGALGLSRQQQQQAYLDAGGMLGGQLAAGVGGGAPGWGAAHASAAAAGGLGGGFGDLLWQQQQQQQQQQQAAALRYQGGFGGLPQQQQQQQQAWGRPPTNGGVGGNPGVQW